MTTSVSITLSGWEKANQMTQEEQDVLTELTGGAEELDEERPGDGSEWAPCAAESRVEVPIAADLRDGLQVSEERKSRLRERLQDLQVVKRDCEGQLSRMDEMMGLKQSLVAKIDSVYSESSALIKKQRLLLVFAAEVEAICRHFLSQERVFHYNNLLKQTASESLSRSNIETVLDLVRLSIEGELFFKMHPHFVGADYQALQWKKIKEILVEAITRKCATQLRQIYLEISKHKPRVSHVTELFPERVTNTEKQREFSVELQRFLLVVSLQPSFLEKTRIIAKDGKSLADLLRSEQLPEAFPSVRGKSQLQSVASNLKSLLESIGGSIDFVQALMFDLTKIKQEGSVTSSIYEDLLSFIFGVKKEISGNVMKEVFQELVALFKTKKIGLEAYLQETISYCLLFTFGEFWDYATCLYKSERHKQVNVLLLRSDDRFRSYLSEFYSELILLVFPAILSEKSSDALFAGFQILNDFVTLPVLPEDAPVKFGETLTLTFETIQLLLPFDAPKVQHLFKDELFCFFYSLFKLFIDQLVKDYRSHLNTFAGNIYRQFFERFDKREFLAAHPLKIPSRADRDLWQKFSAEKHRGTYFRPINVTKYLLGNCVKKISNLDLQKLAYDCISTSLRLLLECSQSFADSFDGSLFVIKNLVELYAFLENDFDRSHSVVKLNQVSFNPKHTSFSNLMKGRYDLETISGILYELMPKMTEYSVDLKQNICKALDHILEKNLEAFSGMVSSPLLEFVAQTRALAAKREGWEALQKAGGGKPDEAGQKRVEAQLKELSDLHSALYSQASVQRVYQSFESTICALLEAMIDKLNCYADENTYRIFQDKFLPYLVDSTVDLLHCFYVDAAKHCSSEAYKSFRFRDVASWKAHMQRAIEQRSSQREAN